MCQFRYVGVDQGGRGLLVKSSVCHYHYVASGINHQSHLLPCSDCDMWPKARLGKRSPLGELLSAPYQTGGAPTGKVPAEADTAWAMAAWQLSSGRFKGHPVLKVSELPLGGV